MSRLVLPQDGLVTLRACHVCYVFTLKNTEIYVVNIYIGDMISFSIISVIRVHVTCRDMLIDGRSGNVGRPGLYLYKS